MRNTATPDVWQNRIVGEGMVAAVELVPHPQNWRRHPKEQARQLAGTLGSVGWVQRVIVNRRTGRMLDGHLRAELARKQGEATPVPVVYVDLSEDEERAVLATLDPIASMAIADEATLAGLVRSIEDADLRTLAGEMAQTLNVNVDGKADAGKDTEAQIDRAEELRQKWGVEPGQLWQLGEHRLICGDCTDPAVVARVMGGENADLMLADPEYDASMDWMSLAAFDAIPHWLIMAGDRQHMSAARMFFARFNQFLVVYFKQFSWNLNVYIPILQHLCVAHYRREGAKNYDLNGLHSIIECSSKFDRQIEHPHAKQTAIIELLIAGFSQKHSATLDLFSGSGTTIIACENLGRRCRAVEIDPGYVAVALERWAVHTGQTPVLLSE